jgi:hypothetical protein
MDPAYWGRLRPKKGRVVGVSTVPMGTSGGGSNKTLSIVLTAVVVIAASLVTYGVGGLAAAGTLGTAMVDRAATSLSGNARLLSSTNFRLITT